jgi:hypothetical protein
MTTVSILFARVALHAKKIAPMSYRWVFAVEADCPPDTDGKPADTGVILRAGRPRRAPCDIDTAVIPQRASMPCMADGPSSVCPGRQPRREASAAKRQSWRRLGS